MIWPGLSRQRTVSFPHEALESERIITDRGPSVLTFPDSSCQSPDSRAPLTSCAASGAVTAATSPATARAIRRTAMLPGGPVRLKDRCAALPRQIPGALVRPRARAPVPAVGPELLHETVGERPPLARGDVGVHVGELAHAGNHGPDVGIGEDESERHLGHAAPGRNDRAEPLGALD